MRSRAATFLGVAGMMGLLPAVLPARILRVPQDSPLISLAAAAARDGDTIEVDDGFYFEKNIVLDKRLTVRAKNLFGAVLYGSGDRGNALFVVRAEVEISGFILKNAWVGILQRDGPDASWTGRDLAFFNMTTAAVSINDREANIGSADLADIIVSGGQIGFSTNDARSLTARRCFIAGARIAFNGSDHFRFRVDDAVVWNCAETMSESPRPQSDPAHSRVELGPNVHVIHSTDPPARRNGLPRLLNALIIGGGGGAKRTSSDSARRRETLLLMILGDYFDALGDGAQAGDHYRAALGQASVLGLEEIRWEASFGLARAAERRGRTEEAVDFYKQTIALIEQITIGLPLRTFCSNFRLDKIGLYETLMRLLLQMDRAAPGKGFDQEAFLFAEKSKARGFLAGLLSPEADVPPGAEPGLRTEERRIHRAITLIQLGLQSPTIAPGRRRALLRRLDTAESERRDFLIRIRKRDAAAFRFHYIQPYDCAAVQERLLGPATALLEYVIGEEFSAAFLLTRAGLTVAPLPPLSALNPLVANYLRFLTLGGQGDFPARSGGARLGALLLAPFRETLGRGIKSLIVIPDGPLHYLPFETLIDAGRSSRFLVEDFDVRYGASASCLINLKDRPVPERYAMDFLGLANPFPTRAFGLSVDEDLSFPALPDSLKEIRDIRGHFDPAKTTVLLGHDAQERAFKSLPLTDYRIIHLAAHGFFDDRNWWRSSLILLPDPQGSEDGFLQPDDVYGLRLAPELLVLSACETGIGRLEKGEGVNGLSYAFFYAGARSILLSLWSVPDRTTAAFMVSFYDYWLAGRPKSEALRLAKIKTLRLNGGNPFYWAAFVLLGN